MKNALVVVAISAVLLMASRPIMAHHAAASYDSEHPVTLQGTVTEFVLVSPHTEIFFDVKDEKGNVTKWVGLSGPPQRLYRAGWRSDSIKPGDKVTVTGAPSKDGHHYLGVKRIVGPNGALPGEGE